ncbi:MAG: hypothetical protein AB1523_00865 [Bacillota bacterium]
MARTYPEYDYDLPEGLLQELSGLSVSALADELSGRAGTEEELTDFFHSYGVRLTEKVLRAGKKYKDRTCAVMEEAAQKTGLVFPGIPQRFIEIWFLATRPQDKWKIVESTARRFVFTVRECFIYQLIKEKHPLTSFLPCREGCLTFLKGIYQELGLPVRVEIVQDMERDGNCRFSCELVQDRS